jgi:zinc transporter 2
MNDEKTAIRKLLCVAAICVVFMFVEIAGGYIANSLAIMTDAAHLFSDVSGFFISIVSLWIG